MMEKIVAVYLLGAVISGEMALYLLKREEKKIKIEKKEKLKGITVAFIYSWVGVYAIWKQLKRKK